jgi:hypothetical protein
MALLVSCGMARSCRESFDVLMYSYNVQFASELCYIWGKVNR